MLPIDLQLHLSTLKSLAFSFHLDSYFLNFFKKIYIVIFWYMWDKKMIKKCGHGKYKNRFLENNILSLTLVFHGKENIQIFHTFRRRKLFFWASHAKLLRLCLISSSSSSFFFLSSSFFVQVELMNLHFMDTWGFSDWELRDCVHNIKLSWLLQLKEADETLWNDRCHWNYRSKIVNSSLFSFAWTSFDL